MQNAEGTDTDRTLGTETRTHPSEPHRPQPKGPVSAEDGAATATATAAAAAGSAAATCSPAPADPDSERDLQLALQLAAQLEADEKAHKVKRCPEAQKLQTIASTAKLHPHVQLQLLSPSPSASASMLRLVRRDLTLSANRFFQVASLPSIQENPFFENLKDDLKEGDSLSVSSAGACGGSASTPVSVPDLVPDLASAPGSGCAASSVAGSPSPGGQPTSGGSPDAALCDPEEAPPQTTPAPASTSPEPQDVKGIPDDAKVDPGKTADIENGDDGGLDDGDKADDSLPSTGDHEVIVDPPRLDLPALDAPQDRPDVTCFNAAVSQREREQGLVRWPPLVGYLKVVDDDVRLAVEDIPHPHSQSREPLLGDPIWDVWPFRRGFVKRLTARFESLAAANIGLAAERVRRIFLARSMQPCAMAAAEVTPQVSPEHSDSRIIPLHSPDHSRPHTPSGHHTPDTVPSEVPDDILSGEDTSGVKPDVVQVPTVVVVAAPEHEAAPSSSRPPPGHSLSALPAPASQRFGRHKSDESCSSSLMSSATSSMPHFDDDAPTPEPGHASTPEASQGSADPSRGKSLLQVPRNEIAARLARLPSIGSCCCRICQNSASMERLISPCHCKGSLAYVHLSCLERWLNQSGRTYCELCQYHFNAVQTPRYTMVQSMRIWFRHPRNRKQLMADILIGSILTVVTSGLLAVTSIGMKYFVDEGTKLGLSAFTTQGTITFFLILVGAGFIVTIYLLIRDQITPWLRWWRTNVDVRLTLDTIQTPPPARAVPTVRRPVQA